MVRFKEITEKFVEYPEHVNLYVSEVFEERLKSGKKFNLEEFE